MNKTWEITHLVMASIAGVVGVASTIAGDIQLATFFFVLAILFRQSIE